MIKYYLLPVLSVAVILLFFSGRAQNPDPASDIHRANVQPGEKLLYKMNYSFITVGKAEILVHPYVYRISGKKYYKIDAYGRTAGAVQIVSSVNDNWGALLDSTSLLPLQSWRNIEEGRYRRKELTVFDQEAGTVSVRVVNNETGKYKEPKNYSFQQSYMHDLISGYVFLRTVDYQGYKVGDTITVSGFFEDTFYNFNILYSGKEKISTKWGKMEAHKLIPVMPDNKIFSGENSITAWFSADQKQIPLKIEARMFIGKAGCEIIGMEGIKNYPILPDE